VERGLGCIHLLERRLARGDVGEDVGETLSGHCEGCVGVVVEYSEVCGVDWGDAGITKLCWWPYWQRRCCSANREPRPNASSAWEAHGSEGSNQTPWPCLALPESAADFSALPFVLLTIGLPPAMTLHDAMSFQ
jgi:hypothetical protein